MIAQRNRHMVGGFAVLLVCCIMVAGILLALAFGARAYRHIAERSETAYDSQIGLSYITAKIHAFDGKNQVSVGNFHGLSALYLRDSADNDAYHTILYVSDGWLYELYSREGDLFVPEDGEQLLEASSLFFEQRENSIAVSLIDVQGNLQNTEVFLRSSGGGT